jgi:2-methylisocitrate lyase-like PEP mutase family enzyme
MAEPTEAVSTEFGTLQSRCDLLRSLHVPSRPLLLPNAWDAATARAVVTAGFPVVATTSAGITAALGYQDREPAIADLAELGVARISWAGSLYRGAMEWLAGKVASLAEEASQAGLPLRSLS